MNWLDPPAEPPAEGDGVPPQDPLSPSMSNLNYWAARLTPLHDAPPGAGEALAGTGVMDAAPPSQSGSTGTGTGAGARVGVADGERAAPDEVVFVACNRVGTELGECLS